MFEHKPTLEYAKPPKPRDIWDVALQVFFILMMALFLTMLYAAVYLF